MFNKLFNPLRKFEGAVQSVNAKEAWAKALSDFELKAEGEKLKNKIRAEADWEKQKILLAQVLPEAFALVRETARRTLGQRHYDIQILGGIALHEGSITEMATGEGKTLGSTAPIFLNALAGRGVHAVTVNEYLAKRDTVWMGQIYHALGLSVACLIHEGALQYDPAFRIPAGDSAMIDEARDTTGNFLVQTEYLRPIDRATAYQSDITYGTNHEFGFDHLRDNLKHQKIDQVQREHHFAVIDEVDSILIDEARTPLIISAPDTESSEFYKTFARLVAGLSEGEDYLKDEKLRSVEILPEGINKIEKALQIDNLYSAENLRLSHYLQESLKAKSLFHRDKEYVVKPARAGGNEVIIVDQFTGRLMPGRRYSGGLHQAIEAKEGLKIQQESRTHAQISIQNYFRMYRKLSGMTGTAATSAEEFHKVYGIEVLAIPTHRPNVRKDLSDLVYKSLDAKYNAIIEDIKTRTAKGQPILIGTVSIQKNEELSNRLLQAGVKHEMLNAKSNEREGAIIAQAGRPGGVTVATNVAGRGVDIILGGNPPSPETAEKVRAAGGLHVIGTERHESRRIDNQLRGRAGRQGDMGSSQFFLSLEDDLMRVFGGERIKNMMGALKVPEDMPIESKLVSRAIVQAQSRVEGFNFDARKHLLEYDDVMNKQRTAIYKRRETLLNSGKINIKNQVGEVTEINLPPIAVSMSLQMIDMLWMNHLSSMEALSESVRLRAYGQRDPLVEYRKEGYQMFQNLLVRFNEWLSENMEKLLIAGSAGPSATSPSLATSPSPQTLNPSDSKVGRNDPCPCGTVNSETGKVYKWKHCGLINASHHKKK